MPPPTESSAVAERVLRRDTLIRGLHAIVTVEPLAVSNVIDLATKMYIEKNWDLGILGNLERIIGSSHKNPRIASSVKFGA